MKMEKAFISPEEQKIVDETYRPGPARGFLARARRHPKSVILTYYRAMHTACGNGTMKNPALAKRWLKRIFPVIREAAMRGDAAAQNCMGCLCDEEAVAGFVVPYDCEEALRWFRKSARRGFLRAQLNIAIAYQFGWGVKINYARAAMWFRRAAEQGSYFSAAHLGVLYNIGGYGLRRDENKSFEWTLRAATMGHFDSEWLLGTKYDRGQGVEASIEKAVSWYRKAADHGSPSGTCLLAYCYARGHGVEQDRLRAWQLYTKAAEMGSPHAQRMLGVGFWHGYNGHVVDLKKAMHWLKKSAKAGLASANEDLKQLKAEQRNRG